MPAMMFRPAAITACAATIDANAPHADEIKVDKILFATGRVMGRILKVDSTPEGLAVTLGPVEITERLLKSGFAEKSKAKSEKESPPAAETPAYSSSS